jgi:hypothetical protein
MDVSTTALAYHIIPMFFKKQHAVIRSHSIMSGMTGILCGRGLLFSYSGNELSHHFFTVAIKHKRVG